MSNLRFLKYLCFLPGQTTALLVPWTKIPDDMNMSVYSIERNQKLTCSDPLPLLFVITYVIYGCFLTDSINEGVWQYDINCLVLLRSSKSISGLQCNVMIFFLKSSSYLYLKLWLPLAGNFLALWVWIEMKLQYHMKLRLQLQKGYHLIANACQTRLGPKCIQQT